VQEAWLPLADVVERIVRATGDDSDFVRNELLKLLRSGVIRGRPVGYQLTIGPQDWGGASISKNGAAVVPFGALPTVGRYKIELHLPDVLHNWPEVHALQPEPGAPMAPEPDTGASANLTLGTSASGEPDVPGEPETDAPEVEQPASVGEPHRPGKRGRPTSRHIFMPEFICRHAKGERHGTMTAWSRVLAKWQKDTHPAEPPATASTIYNYLSAVLPSDFKANL
jgi:hypothetical protein